MLEEIIKVLRENERVLLLEIHEISVSVLYIVQRTDQSDWVEKRLQCELQRKPYRLHLIREKIYIYILKSNYIICQLNYMHQIFKQTLARDI